MATGFEAVEAGYANLWAHCEVRTSHLHAIETIVAGIHHAEGSYHAVEAATHVPWWVVGIIDQMEGGGGARTHLHNGDSLHARTHNVPAGRPPGGRPPFTFLASAIDAVHYDGLDRVTDWTVPRILFLLEKYNGEGYFRHGVNSPYLWSYTNQYGTAPNVGKFVSDGRWNGSAISEQAGAAAILKVLAPQVAGAKPLPPVKTDPSVSHNSFLEALNGLFATAPGPDGKHTVLTNELNNLFGRKT